MLLVDDVDSIIIIDAKLPHFSNVVPLSVFN